MKKRLVIGVAIGAAIIVASASVILSKGYCQELEGRRLARRVCEARSDLEEQQAVDDLSRWMHRENIGGIFAIYDMDGRKVPYTELSNAAVPLRVEIRCHLGWKEEWPCVLSINLRNKDHYQILFSRP